MSSLTLKLATKQGRFSVGSAPKSEQIKLFSHSDSRVHCLLCLFYQCSFSFLKLLSIIFLGGELLAPSFLEPAALGFMKLQLESAVGECFS